MKMLNQSFRGQWHLARETPVAVGGVELLALQLEGRTLNGDNTALDRFTAALGSVATVFVRQGNEFYRVATSLKREDGQRRSARRSAARTWRRPCSFAARLTWTGARSGATTWRVTKALRDAQVRLSALCSSASISPTA